jgi:hypothetical protein
MEPPESEDPSGSNFFLHLAVGRRKGDVFSQLRLKVEANCGRATDHRHRSRGPADTGHDERPRTSEGEAAHAERNWSDVARAVREFFRNRC